MRLRELRKQRGIKQLELCKALGIAQSTLSGYETNQYEPDNKTLEKIADYFGVSVDYLLGRTDESAHTHAHVKGLKPLDDYGKIPAPCRAVLDEWVKDKPSDDFMFGCGSPASLNPIRTYFDTHIERAGVSRIRIHGLRHSFVSMLLSLGASVPTVASLIGDTIEQVVKTYAHSIEDDKIAIISKIV